MRLKGRIAPAFGSTVLTGQRLVAGIAYVIVEVTPDDAVTILVTILGGGLFASCSSFWLYAATFRGASGAAGAVVVLSAATFAPSAEMEYFPENVPV